MPFGEVIYTFFNPHKIFIFNGCVFQGFFKQAVKVRLAQMAQISQKRNVEILRKMPFNIRHGRQNRRIYHRLLSFFQMRINFVKNIVKPCQCKGRAFLLNIKQIFGFFRSFKTVRKRNFLQAERAVERNVSRLCHGKTEICDVKFNFGTSVPIAFINNSVGNVKHIACRAVNSIVFIHKFYTALFYAPECRVNFSSAPVVNI